MKDLILAFGYGSNLLIFKQPSQYIFLHAICYSCIKCFQQVFWFYGPAAVVLKPSLNFLYF